MIEDLKKLIDKRLRENAKNDQYKKLIKKASNTTNATVLKKLSY